MAIRTLTEVGQVGERCFHYFTNQSTGEVVRVPCTDEEYNALSLPGAGAPAYQKGFVWKSSTREIKYDTPDGDLPPDSFFTLPSGKHIVRFAEKKPFELVEANPEEIVNGQADIVYGNSI